ncbi:hypothetical protein BDF19DRAFT_57483 [Syncephalis fuscata]|nr:hypothetical protein BDF19DRAFT_57483 [Syncephalis fuscata]
MVIVGLRCAILIDQVTISLRELEDVVKKLSLQFPGYPILCSINIKDYVVFITSVEQLQKRLACNIKCTLDSLQFILVDRAYKHPCMLDDKSYQQFTDTFNQIVCSLRHCLESRAPDMYTIEATSFIDESIMIAFTGWILEYPAIYVQKDLTGGNCLAVESLWLVRAFAFHVNDSEQEHLLHSFSIPCALLDDDTPETWIKQWRANWHNRMKQQLVWHKLRISIEQVTLPAVIL